MEHDWKAFVRARLPLDGIDPAGGREIVDEIAQHAADLYRDLTDSGLPDEDAVRAIEMELREGETAGPALGRLRRPRRVPPPAPPAPDRFLWRGVVHDLAYCTRLLAHRPAFAAVAVVTMALAIGATTAVYTVVRAALLRPLPYPLPHQIVAVGEASDGLAPSSLGYLTWRDWRTQARSFSGLSLMRSWLPGLSGDGPSERLIGVRVTADYFRTLQVAPSLGRDFSAADDTVAGRRVVIISDRLWHRRFGGDPTIVGRSITLDGSPFRVGGVLPPGFEPLIEQQLYGRADIWAPIGYDATLGYACRRCQHLKAVARLRDGVTPEAARAEMETIQRRLRRQFPNEYADARMTVVPFVDLLHAPIKPMLLVLLGASVSVLLVACANLSGLLIVRASAREHEIAIRAALGASRGRLAQHLLTESVLIAAAAGLLGVVLAVWLRDLFVRLAPSSVPRLDSAAIDLNVLACAAAATLVSAAIAGTVPALRGAATDLLPVLRRGGRGLATKQHQRPRRVLVGAQLAIAIVLLTSAGLMVRSMAALATVRPGFDPRHLLTFETSFVGPAYAEDRRVETLTSDMLARIRTLPGVDGVATVSQFPLGGNMDRWGVYLEGRSLAIDEVPSLDRFGVTPDYLRVMKIPLLAGRFFTWQDRRDSEPVVVINEKAAHILWPDGDAIGARLRIGSAAGAPWRRIVGIVGDVRHVDLDSPLTMQVYTPNAQMTDSFLTFVVKTHVPPERLVSPVQAAVWSVADDVPVHKIATGQEIVDRTTATRRFVTALLVSFAAVAVLLSSVGLYGVIAFSVATRRREIGVRIAYGAGRADIVRLIALNALPIVIGGAIAGLAASLLLTQGLRALLFAVAPSDPAAYAGAALLLLVTAAGAHLLPVRRALAVDPTVALKEE